jgi:hypothetical protein
VRIAKYPDHIGAELPARAPDNSSTINFASEGAIELNERFTASLARSTIPLSRINARTMQRVCSTPNLGRTPSFLSSLPWGPTGANAEERATAQTDIAEAPATVSLLEHCGDDCALYIIAKRQLAQLIGSSIPTGRP